MKKSQMWKRSILLGASVLLIALTAWAAAGGAQLQQSEISASSEKQEGVAAQTTPALPAVVLAQIDVVAAKMVETIQSQHFSKVLVLGAKGPDKKSLQLGMMVGDAFSASIEKQKTGFQVVTRYAIRDFLNGLEANMEEALTDEWKDGICDKLGADALVMMRFESIGERNATVSVFLFKATNGITKSLAGWKFELPLDHEMQAASSNAIPKKEVEKGITNPECEYCPRPDFSDRPRKPQEAVIYVWILVGADGRASDAKVMSSTYPKFDAEALRTLSTWKFKPARDSKGEKVAQHVQVIVTYQIL